MTSKKLHILIFSLFLVMLLALQSCEKKSLKTTKKQHSRSEIDTLIAVAHKYFEKGKFDSSYYYFNKVKSLCDVKKDTSEIIYSLLNIATIEQNQGNYHESENTVTKAIPLLINNTKPSHHWGIYTTLGINYMFLHDYKRAIYYHNKASKLKTDKTRIQDSKNNIALVYMEHQDYQKAIQILLPLTLDKGFISNEDRYIIIDNLGYCFFKIKDSRAFYYLNKALIINTKNKYEWGLITSYSRLAEFYMKNNPRLAYKYSSLAYEKATKIKDINDRLINLVLLIKSSKGDLLKKHVLDYIRINDSNNKAKQIAKNQFAKMKYDGRKEIKENQKMKIEKFENEIQLEQQKNRVLLLFYFITTGIIATLGIVKYLYSKNKTDKIKTMIETENRISKKLHDEVANDLFQTIAFTETQDLGSNENKALLLSNLVNIYYATRNISRENSPLVKGIEFETEIKELLNGFNSETVNIIANGIEQVDWKKLDNIKKIIVYRVLQELLINMKKHSNCSLAMLIFKKNKNNLEINYSDDGAGAPIDEIIKGKGLQNVRNRILDVKGNITFESEPNKGFKSNIVLPL